MKPNMYLKTDNRGELIPWDNIDEGIREVVNEFNKIPGWRTDESCEGHLDREDSFAAFISFSVIGIKGIRQAQMLEFLLIQKIQGFNLELGPFCENPDYVEKPYKYNEICLTLNFLDSTAIEISDPLIEALKELGQKIKQNEVPEGCYI